MNKIALVYTVTSATLYGLSPPLAKIILKDIQPMALAGLLCLGAIFMNTTIQFGNRMRTNIIIPSKVTFIRIGPIAITDMSIMEVL